MKKRIIALALATIMVAGSAMSTTAANVFTAGSMTGAVVKDGAMVDRVNVIDVDVYASAVDKKYNDIAGEDFSCTVSGNGYVNFTSDITLENYLSDEAWDDLETALQNDYDGANSTTIVSNLAQLGFTGDVSKFSYKVWAASLRIAPGGERYSVASGQAMIYKDLAAIASSIKAQASVKISVEDVEGPDMADKFTGLDKVIVKTTRDDRTLSAAKLKINNVTLLDNSYVNLIGVSTRGAAKKLTLADEDDWTYYYDVRGVCIAKANIPNTNIKKNDSCTIDDVVYAFNQNIRYSSNLSISDGQELYAKATKWVERFTASQKYFEAEAAEGLSYLVRRTTGLDCTAKKVAALDLDYTHNLSWRKNEVKTIAFTSPNLQNIDVNKSYVVLHLDSETATWEALEASIVEYNGVKGIEANFTSCSPVIVVEVGDAVISNTESTVSKTDVKTSPKTGEEF